MTSKVVECSVRFVMCVEPGENDKTVKNEIVELIKDAMDGSFIAYSNLVITTNIMDLPGNNP